MNNFIKNISLENKKDMIWQHQKKSWGEVDFLTELSWILLPCLSCYTNSWPFPFDERTYNITAQLNLISDSDVWTHPPITITRKSPTLDYNFI